MHRLLIIGLILIAAGCGSPASPPEPSAVSSDVRAARRAYAGAPPVIPHPRQAGSCTTCHTTEAKPVPGLGLAPPNPHRHTPGLSDRSRCVQCHIFSHAHDEFSGTTFAGLSPATPHGDRLYPHAPPRVPHRLFLREDCLGCHAGPAARPEIRCTHADRTRCLQCHVPISGTESPDLADVPTE